MKRLVAFDLDGTLAESKQAIQPDMAEALAGLSHVAAVCVISGGDWPQFQTQVVGRLPADAARDRFFIMPTTGTKLYRFGDQGWQPVYDESFSAEERQRILDALTAAVQAAGLAGEKTWGQQIEDRGSQITFSGLGQEAPLEAKKAWDPDRKKREAVQAAVRKALPGFAVNIGGATSIDITREGVDKAYGIEKLAAASGIPKADMIFLGDAVFPGGNDWPVPDRAGVDTIAVGSVGETMRAIQAITLCLRSA
jgi:HAD superfamily hydrolase (TIGR01484 family)